LNQHNSILYSWSNSNRLYARTQHPWGSCHHDNSIHELFKYKVPSVQWRMLSLSRVLGFIRVSMSLSRVLTSKLWDARDMELVTTTSSNIVRDSVTDEISNDLDLRFFSLLQRNPTRSVWINIVCLTCISSRYLVLQVINISHPVWTSSLGPVWNKRIFFSCSYVFSIKLNWFLWNSCVIPVKFLCSNRPLASLAHPVRAAGYQQVIVLSFRLSVINLFF